MPKKNNINQVLIAIFLLVTVILMFYGFKEVKAVTEYTSSNSSNETIIINSSSNLIPEGRIKVYFSEYYTAKKLIKNNPSIEAVSYYDEVFDKSVGFVNIFGGIGKDFTIYPGRVYEINTKSQILLNLN